MKVIYILLILGSGTVQKPDTVSRMEFNTLEACEKAAEFYTRNPYPALNMWATCVEDKKAEESKRKTTYVKFW